MAFQKDQKNSLFHLIRDLRIDPREFDLEEVSDQLRLVHGPTGYYFIVEPDGRSFWCVHMPGTKKVADKAEMAGAAETWHAVLRMAEGWAARVREESEVPDLWETVKSTKNAPSIYKLWHDPAVERVNTAFSEPEIAAIHESLDRLSEDLIKNLDLGDEKKGALANQIGYLKIAAERVGRYDWKNILGNTVLGLVYELRLNQSRTHRMFQLTALHFQNSFQKSAPAAIPA